jgi:hypothetical protein
MKIKRFYCSIESCNKSFRSQDHLEAHEVSHTIRVETEEEKFLFECDVCNQKFPTKRSVSAHRRIHKYKSKLFISTKVIKMLSAKLSGFLQSHYSIAESPFSGLDLQLPELKGPQEANLPSFETILMNQSG